MRYSDGISKADIMTEVSYGDISVFTYPEWGLKQARSPVTLIWPLAIHLGP